MNQLEEKGYLIIRGRLTDKDVETGRACIRDKTVNYTAMTGFIEQIMLDTINKEIGTAIQYTKYRVSDNNNSDAATFHRDNVCLGDLIPVLTCLTYLDKTTMEVIPGSHRIKAASLLETPAIYATRERIQMNPGDLLVFYGTMLHRGLLTEATTHRRLIQVFECFKTPEDYANYSRRLIHVAGDEKSGSNVQIVRSIPGVQDATNIASYINMITGCGGDMSKYVIEKCGLGGSQRDVFCSEGFCKRLTVEPNTWQEINRYILKKQPLVDLPETCKQDWRWAFYTRQFLLMMVFALLLLAALGVGIFYAVRRLIAPTAAPKRRRVRT